MLNCPAGEALKFRNLLQSILMDYLQNLIATIDKYENDLKALASKQQKQNVEFISSPTYSLRQEQEMQKRFEIEQSAIHEKINAAKARRDAYVTMTRQDDPRMEPQPNTKQEKRLDTVIEAHTQEEKPKEAIQLKGGLAPVHVSEIPQLSEQEVTELSEKHVAFHKSQNPREECEEVYKLYLVAKGAKDDNEFHTREFLKVCYGYDDKKIDQSVNHLNDLDKKRQEQDDREGRIKKYQSQINAMLNKQNQR